MTIKKESSKVLWCINFEFIYTNTFGGYTYNYNVIFGFGLFYIINSLSNSYSYYILYCILLPLETMHVYPASVRLSKFCLKGNRYTDDLSDKPQGSQAANAHSCYSNRAYY